ncbi:hypothetical protein [Rhodanobacter sp. PCA2]|uniref:hypothetical protein n=1 Tax=Rhodanobacter sp. PCA2 TaxID=2006117 RepID=UPI0031B82518
MSSVHALQDGYGMFGTGTLLIVLACVATALSAALLYAASPHWAWRTARRRRGALASGLALAVLALVGWVATLGAGAGSCAMLAGWMLALAAQPWLALLACRRDAEAALADGD